MSFTMHVPTKIIFGNGKLSKLHKEVLPGKNALIVISNGKSTRASGYLDRLIDELNILGISYHIFDKIEANPLKSSVMAGASFARETGCDFIIGLGGGSVMDASKSIALMATNEGDYWDYMLSGSGLGKTVENKPLPFVAITTTAGTGSEADGTTVITNELTNEKTGFASIDLFPVISIVDPELTKTVPALYTAYQGFDALFHSVESYINAKANLISDMYALTAIENVAKYLPRAVKDGSDIVAREQVAFANTLSGVVMTLSGCTSEHGLEHAMSAYHQELAHGAGLIMISLAYHEHFIKAGVCDERYIKMAQVMGMENATKPEDFLVALHNLQLECGVAELKMSDYGIVPEEFTKMAENAKFTMMRVFNNDRVMLEIEDCMEIYSKSYK